MFNAAGNQVATLAGVVPDSVRTIRLTYYARTTTIGVTPGTNFWSTRVPGPIPDIHAGFIWMDSHAQTVARFSGVTEAPY